ncbi:MAG: hypothetical protein ACRCSN_21210 [Dermatophilaceae bacterium]
MNTDQTHARRSVLPGWLTGNPDRRRGSAYWPEHHRPDGARCPWSGTLHRRAGVPCPAGCPVTSIPTLPSGTSRP